MGNICDTMGITRKDGNKLENIAIDPRNSNGERNTEEDIDQSGNPTTKSPVAAAALMISADAVRAAELKAEYARRKALEEAEVAAKQAAMMQVAGPRIRLLPHQHTLFCERKQRVCTASGQLQEMEVLALEGFDGPLPPFIWIRIKPEHLRHFTAEPQGAIDPALYEEAQQEHPLDENGGPTHADHEYVLTREDVGHFMGVRYALPRPSQLGREGAGAPLERVNCPPPAPSSDAALLETAADRPSEQDLTGVEHHFLALSSLGEVRPGPPRLTTFKVTGNLKPGSVAVAEVHYIGGYEGFSEYWWMRIGPDGRRTQVTEAQKVPFPSSAARKHSTAEFAVRASFSLGGPGGPGGPGASQHLQPGASAATAEALRGALEAEGQGAEKGGEGEGEGAQGPVRMVMDGLSVGAADARPSAFSVMSDADAALIDPRLYQLTEDDVGCVLKAKCRPVRSDGVVGEIFTSEPSEEVQPP